MTMLIRDRQPNWGKPGKYLITKREDFRVPERPWAVWSPEGLVPCYRSPDFWSALAFVIREIKDSI